MPATPWIRTLLTHGLVAACALGVGLVVARSRAGARSEPVTHDAGGAPRGPLQPARRTLAEAQVEARARDLPVLLLVAPPCERCAPALRLRDLITGGPGGQGIVACAVPALLEVDPTSPSPEAEYLAARVGEVVLPYLLVLAPWGDILHRQFGGLYPVFDESGQPAVGKVQEVLHDAESLVQLVDRAMGRGVRESRRLALLRAGRSAAGWVEAAELLERQGHVEDAVAQARRALGEDLPAGVSLRAARLLERQHQEPEAVAAVERALARGPTPAERDRLALWLDRVQGLPPYPSAAGLAPTLSAVLTAAQARQDAAVVLEARVRIALAANHAVAHETAAREALVSDLAWAAAHLADLPREEVEGVPVLKDLLRLAQVADQPALRVAFMRALMERYPEHPAAQEPRHGFLCAEEARAGLR